MDPDRFSKLLLGISAKPLHVLDSAVPYSKYIPLDLSEKNTELDVFDISSSKKLTDFVNSHIEKHGAFAAYGGYLERRAIYRRSIHFNTLNPNTERNIHLGIDFWCPENTPIYTPLEATVHSFKNNTNHGDYGPVIILEHKLEGEIFYTLYGHLSVSSITFLQKGQAFKQGEQIATLAGTNVNGDYPPHLHFQIIKDLEGYVGDYPGVCNAKDLKFYKSNCPDPNLLLKVYC